MIFLTVGTWRNGYNRLVHAVDELKKNSVISEEVVAQTGYGAYVPQHLEVVKFCSPAKFRDLVNQATLIISHAGMGTIIEAVKLGKPIIAVPRQPSLEEVDNDHQFTTARQLESEGRILVAYDVSELAGKLVEARNFVPAKGEGGERILQAVKQVIEAVAAKKRSGGEKKN